MPDLPLGESDPTARHTNYPVQIVVRMTPEMKDRLEDDAAENKRTVVTLAELAP